MAIHLDLMRRIERVEMKGLLGGLVVAVALASLGSDASAALTDGAALIWSQRRDRVITP